MRNSDKIIFHFPTHINKSIISGSTIRPRKMQAAFATIGYDVIEISGYSKQRINGILHAKSIIESGKDIIFMYAESANFPTIFLDKDHIPRRPLLDYRFFYYVKQRDIPIGLFYRDIYWKFNTYKKEVNIGKRMLIIPFFYLDLLMYQLLVDILFVPSESFVRYIPKQFSFKNILVLPPGCDNYEPGNTKPISDTLNILYVGNIAPPEHDVTLIFDVARAIRGTINEIKFIISCPADVWKTYQNYYLGSNSAPSNIEIVHKKPNDISDLFIKCDLFILPINDEYSAMASPNRFYTALGFEVPFIIASNYDTEVGKIVKRDNIGWVVNHSVYSIISLLKAIKDNITMLELAKDNLKRIKSDHTWNKRAIFVADTLENIGLYK